MARYMDTDMAAARAVPAAGATPNLIRWGAVLGGVVLGLSLLLLLTALWVAMAYAGGIEAMQDNIAWWTAASAVVAMFVGGLLAGWLSGVPGAGSGFFNGLAVWALILIGSLIIGVPGALQAANLDAMTLNGAEVDLATQGNALWATFFSLLIGALAAGIGGAIGGAVTRPAFMRGAAHVAEREERHVEPQDERFREPHDAHDVERGRERYDERYDERHERDRALADPDRYRDRPVETRREFGDDAPREPYRGDVDRGHTSEPFDDERREGTEPVNRTPREERTIDLREQEANRPREF